MSNVGIGHDEIVISYICDASAMHRSSVHRYVFFNYVIVAYYEGCVLFFVRYILWRTTKG